MNNDLEQVVSQFHTSLAPQVSFLSFIVVDNQAIEQSLKYLSFLVFEVSQEPSQEQGHNILDSIFGKLNRNHLYPSF